PDKALAHIEKEPQARILALGQRMPIVTYLPATVEKCVADAQIDRKRGVRSWWPQEDWPGGNVLGFWRVIDEERHAVPGLLPMAMREQLRSGRIRCKEQKGRLDSLAGDLTHQIGELLVEEMSNRVAIHKVAIVPFVIAVAQKALSDQIPVVASQCRQLQR